MRSSCLKSRSIAILLRGSVPVGYSINGQIITEVQGMKDTIVELKQAIKDAAARQDQAKQDVKRIEKDMNEFKNNKDSKLQQLQVQYREATTNSRNKWTN
jgi:peptidoglycan hydrolase CwlO-like protein